MSEGGKRPSLAPRPGAKRTRVMIEPKDRETASRVLRELQALGATRVREVTEGFISAEVPAEAVIELNAIARTGVLPPKKPLGR
jgi:hypothetical protein